MTLNASGPISLAGATTGQSIAVELGQSSTGQISLNDSNVRTLAGVASGAITMPTNFWGKSNRAAISYVFSANTTQTSINVAALGGYVAGKSDITITVNSGIWVYSTSTGSPALTLTGGSLGDTVTIVNNGYIAGMGGRGGYANTTDPNSGAALPGGPALSLGFNTTINNTNASAYIGGGGGGGDANSPGGGGGGAGGGAGGNGSGAGGAGGSPGSAGSSGGASGGLTGGGGGGAGGGGGSVYIASKGGSTGSGGGGGGRIFPGSGGSGGTSGTYNGGSGGSGNSAGQNSVGPCGGGGWGASGGQNNYGGGAGGKAVALNGYTVTWVNGDTSRVYGAVS